MNTKDNSFNILFKNNDMICYDKGYFREYNWNTKNKKDVINVLCKYKKYPNIYFNFQIMQGTSVYNTPMYLVSHQTIIKRGKMTDRVESTLSIIDSFEYWNSVEIKELISAIGDSQLEKLKNLKKI